MAKGAIEATITVNDTCWQRETCGTCGWMTPHLDLNICDNVNCNRNRVYKEDPACPAWQGRE